MFGKREYGCFCVFAAFLKESGAKNFIFFLMIYHKGIHQKQTVLCGTYCKNSGENSNISEQAGNL